MQCAKYRHEHVIGFLFVPKDNYGMSRFVGILLDRLNLIKISYKRTQVLIDGGFRKRFYFVDAYINLPV